MGKRREGNSTIPSAMEEREEGQGKFYHPSLYGRGGGGLIYHSFSNERDGGRTRENLPALLLWKRGRRDEGKCTIPSAVREEKGKFYHPSSNRMEAWRKGERERRDEGKFTFPFPPLQRFHKHKQQNLSSRTRKYFSLKIEILSPPLLALTLAQHRKPFDTSCLFDIAKTSFDTLVNTCHPMI